MGNEKELHPDHGKVVELEEINIILRIPKEAVALEVTASLLDDDGKVVKAARKFPVSEIREMRQAFLDNVEDGDDYDAQFVITDEGLEYLQSLKEDGG